jgi:hypothetical protein
VPIHLPTRISVSIRRKARCVRGSHRKVFTAGPETFVNPEFWSVVRSYDIADPGNPYSFKKYLSYNRFRWFEWMTAPDANQSSATTAQHRARLRFKAPPRRSWGTVPEGWVERSVSFFANNRYEGWTTEDMADPRRWFDLNNYLTHRR